MQDTDFALFACPPKWTRENRSPHCPTSHSATNSFKWYEMKLFKQIKMNQNVVNPCKSNNKPSPKIFIFMGGKTIPYIDRFMARVPPEMPRLGCSSTRPTTTSRRWGSASRQQRCQPSLEERAHPRWSKGCRKFGTFDVLYICLWPYGYVFLMFSNRFPQDPTGKFG